MSYKISALKVDVKGQSAWIDREAESMDPLQYARELVVNAAEAGASDLVIDGWEDVEIGAVFTRYSDDGQGMSRDHLAERMRTLHSSGTGRNNNYGVGARVATMPFNHGGVTWASLHDDYECMVQLQHQRGVYGLVDWGDDTGFFAAPDPHMMEWIGRTGTAVILHGDDGAESTYTRDEYLATRRFIGNRFFRFPHGMGVSINHPDETRTNIVLPMETRLERLAATTGAVPFHTPDGLTGAVHWWVLPASKERHRTAGIQNLVPGVGWLADGEVFQFNRDHGSDFGLNYKSVSSRVVLLVEVKDAKMNTARSGLYLPKRSTGVAREYLPWKLIGRLFMENLPEQIKVLNDNVTTSSTAMNVELARRLDPEWVKGLKPVKVVDNTKPGTNPYGGDDCGDVLGGEEDSTLRRRTGPRRVRRRNPQPGDIKTPVQRVKGGSNPVGTSMRVTLPAVEFVVSEEWDHIDDWVVYMEGQNLVQVNTAFNPYQRTIAKWKRLTEHSDALVESAVQYAYTAELSAHIIDANGQRATVGAERIEEWKSPIALESAMLGMLALETLIKEQIAVAVSAA